ncbi:MAG TPA: hypothetical protein VFX98_06970, partial [Longimicrobiaceae bacterium]|nr:hypothetical protein [Longimicrobiaceae bacterium]
MKTLAALACLLLLHAVPAGAQRRPAPFPSLPGVVDAFPDTVRADSAAARIPAAERIGYRTVLGLGGFVVGAVAGGGAAVALADGDDEWSDIAGATLGAAAGGTLGAALAAASLDTGGHCRTYGKRVGQGLAVAAGVAVASFLVA